MFAVDTGRCSTIADVHFDGDKESENEVDDREDYENYKWSDKDPDKLFLAWDTEAKPEDIWWVGCWIYLNLMSTITLEVFKL